MTINLGLCNECATSVFETDEPVVDDDVVMHGRCVPDDWWGTD